MNINEATREELAGLPEVSAELAGAIVAERERGGDFHSLEELLRVPGLPDRALYAIREAGAFVADVRSSGAYQAGSNRLGVPSQVR